MEKKRSMILIVFLILLAMPLTSAGNYGSEEYGCGLFGVGCSATTPPPSGGGSSGRSTPSCTYDWQCTNWFPTECSPSGVQERICANKGTCTGTTGIPTQSQTCEYIHTEPLFDIYLTLSDDYKEICAGNKIKASIMLENYGKIELLDAFMTYWIINENNTLITELKDTRAVTNEKAFEISIELPESAVGGTYRIYAQINYNENKTAVAGESFEVLAKEDCKLYSQIKFNWIYLVYGGIGIFILLLVLILIKVFGKRKKKAEKLKTHKEYKSKIKQNLKKIKSKTFLIILAGFMLIGVLFIGGSSMTGFIVGSANAVNNNWNIFGFVLIIGMLGLLVFSYRKKIVERIEIKRINKYSKDSIKGLIKKKVYTEDGDYIGKVDEVLLGENKIDSVRIKLDKKHKFKVKGILIKYKNVKSFGHIVIVNEAILEKLNI